MSVKTRKEFQQFLKDKGFYFGAIDGIIGRGSKDAILACFRNKKAPAITESERFQLARRLGDTDTVRIKAVAKVEANGSGWFNDGMPKILYERHKFWAHNDDVSAPKSTFFNYPSWGNYTVDADKNGINDSYDKLIKACEYDPRGAFMAVSMGAFQVMGEYYIQMGYKTPWEMLYACTHSDKARNLALPRFISIKETRSWYWAFSECVQAYSISHGVLYPI